MASFWEKLKSAPSFTPTAFSIASARTDQAENLSTPFDKSHYFTVRVNEMFLTNSRKWFSEFHPMVMTVAEFLYDGKPQTVPFVVGPQMMQKKQSELPKGMLFSDTRVAGIHPYKGGRLSLTVTLNSVERSNYFDKMLAFIEDTSSVLDFATSLSSYVKVGKALMGGLESLLDLGGTQPIVGQRFEIDPDAGDTFQPGYYVLINAPEGQVDADKLWVKDRSLYYGTTLAKAEPFRSHDYVLYSVTQSTRRSDERSLPFIEIWDDILTQLERMNSFEEKDWNYVRGKMFQLRSVLLRSPDLTRQQALALFDDYKAQVLEAKEELKDFDLSRSGNDDMPKAPTAAPRDSEMDVLSDLLNL